MNLIMRAWLASSLEEFTENLTPALCALGLPNRPRERDCPPPSLSPSHSLAAKRVPSRRQHSRTHTDTPVPLPGVARDGLFQALSCSVFPWQRGRLTLRAAAAKAAS